MVTYTIDTFTADGLSGNPTGVCYLRDALNNDAMLNIAKELNFPVTAFIQPRGNSEYDIRYFTPITEIPACGHATLAAAKVAALEDNNSTPIFHTSNKVVINAISAGDLIMMSYPEYGVKKFDVTQEMLDSLQLTAYKSAWLCTELEAVFIELDDAGVLKTVQPDYAALVKSNETITEVVLTCSGDSNYDFILRAFCPWIGIDEDPVTGSVHSVLAGFWKERLHKNELKAYQASERGGEVIVRYHPGKIEIGGRVTMHS